MDESIDASESLQDSGDQIRGVPAAGKISRHRDEEGIWEVRSSDGLCRSNDGGPGLQKLRRDRIAEAALRAGDENNFRIFGHDEFSRACLEMPANRADIPGELLSPDG